MIRAYRRLVLTSGSENANRGFANNPAMRRGENAQVHEHVAFEPPQGGFFEDLHLRLPNDQHEGRHSNRVRGSIPCTCASVKSSILPRLP